MKVAQIIGVAGAGKSTLVIEMTSRWQHRQRLHRPVTHEHWLTTHGKRVVTLGHYDTVFGGTDTLPYAAIDEMGSLLAMFADRSVHAVIVEGDRLANDRFISIAKQHATHLLYHLHADDALLSSRRLMRAAQHRRATQSQQWLKGRATKVRRLTESHTAITLDASLPPAHLADVILHDIT